MLDMLHMLMWIDRAVAIIMLFCSVILSLVSLGFARRETIWKAFGLWGFSLGSGVTFLVAAFYMINLKGEERAILRAAGQPVRYDTDMPGFGETMFGLMGVCYFGALFVLIMIIYSVDLLRKSRP